MVERQKQQPALAPGQQEVLGVLKKHSFLKSIAEEHLRYLAGHAVLVEYTQGDLVFKQGDPANSFYLVVIGSIALTHAGLRRNEHIQTLAEGDVLGWSWLFPPMGWQFNARALDRSRLLMLDASSLQKYCERHPDFGYEFMRRITRVVVDRLQITRRKLFKLTGGL